MLRRYLATYRPVGFLLAGTLIASLVATAAPGLPTTARASGVHITTLVPAAASCNGPVTIVVSDQTQALATDAVRARPWQPTEQEPVTLTVDMPHVMSYGQPVPIRVTLHNGTTHPMAIGFGRMQGFDVLVAKVLERIANRDERPRWKDSSFFKRFAG